MNGQKFEKKCAVYLKRKGFRHVQITRGSGDQGIDILAKKGGKKYGFQCKYYQTPVGNKAVQEAYSGAKYYECDVAVVITNTTFTKSAKELAERTEVRLWENQKLRGRYGLLFTVTRLMGWLSLILGSLCLYLVWADPATASRPERACMAGINILVWVLSRADKNRRLEIFFALLCYAGLALLTAFYGLPVKAPDEIQRIYYLPFLILVLRLLFSQGEESVWEEEEE